MFTKINVICFVFATLLSGCVINFKAEKLELDSKPVTPKAEISLYKIKPESIWFANRKELSWLLSNTEAVSSKCQDQSPETHTLEIATETMFVRELNQ